MKVMKFGGTSVGTPSRMKEVTTLVTKSGEPVFVVLSAMSGTTNSLVEISDYLYKKNPEGANEVINQLERKYMKHIDELYSTDAMKEQTRDFIVSEMNYLRSFTKELFTSFEEKSIVAQGEMMSTNMVVNYMKENGIKAVLLNALDFMRTDKNSEPDPVYIKEKLSETKLTELCESSERTRKALLSTLPHRSGKNLRNTMTLDMMEMLDLHLLLGTPEAERFAAHMKHDIAYADTYQGLNLVWGHVSPYFLEGIGRQIDCTERAQIVASDMMFDFLEPEGEEARLRGARADGLLFGPETPYEFMAERVVRNCFNGPAERRGRTLVRLAQATHADGAVIFCHWGCRQTAGASQLMRQMLEDAGYPVLVLDGDAVDRANCMEGQMTTRFDAFLELLEAHRG